jgi:RNA polymerase sigma-70 factor (ECF subfamily)
MPDIAPPSLDEALAHEDFVRSMAKSVLGRDAEVEDAVQETWLVAMRRGPRDRASLRSWLGSVARNAALTIRRATSRRAVREKIAARAEALPSAERIAEVEDARRRLIHAVLALDEPYRSTLLLRYYTGLSPTDIAAAQGVPQETVRTRLQRGLARLRERFAADHAGDRRSAALALLPLAFPDGAPPIPFPWAEVIVVKKIVVAVAALLVIALGVGWGTGWIASRASDAAPVAAPRAAMADGTEAGLAARPTIVTAAKAGSSSPSDEWPRVVLFGHVVGEDGKPLAGAHVWAARKFGDEPPTAVRTGDDGRFEVNVDARERLFAAADGHCVALAANVGRGADHAITLFKTVGVLRGRVLDPDGKPIASARIVIGGFQGRATTATRSDDDGRFEMPGTPAFWGQSVTVSAAGFVPANLSMPPDVGGGARLVVRLERAGVVTGLVLDATTRTPIVGASVVIVGSEFHAIETDGDGRFRLVADVGVTQGQVRATAAGHRPEVVRVATVGAADVELALEPLVAIEGRVLDGNGRPAAGAEVRWSGNTGPRTSADTDGRFHLSASAPSATRPVVIVARNAGRGFAVASVTDAKPVELRLAPAAVITGVVLDADGAPVAGAIVRAAPGVEGPDGQSAWTILELLGHDSFGGSATDAQGRFRIDDLPAEPIAVHADRPGSDRSLSTWAAKADLRAVEITEVEIRAVGGRTLTGVVVDEAGLPVPFADVDGDGDRAIAGRDGRFTLHIAPAVPTATTRVGAKTEVYEPRSDQVLADAKDVRIVLKRRRAIRLRLEGAVPPDGTAIEVAVQAADVSGHTLTATVENGEVAFDGAASDSMRVAVHSSTAVGGPVDVAMDRTTHVGVATIRVERATSITGVVVDEAGTPIRGANIQLFSRERFAANAETLPGPSATTANDGTFSVRGVASGSVWRLGVRGDSAYTQTVVDSVAAGTTDLRIVLVSSGGVITGRVVVPAGDAAIALRVDDKVEGATSSSRGDVEPDGRFRLSNLRTGRHILAAVRSEHRGPEQTIDVRADGNSADVVLVAPESGLSIRGQLVDAKGAPVSFAASPPSLPPGVMRIARSGEPALPPSLTGLVRIVRPGQPRVETLVSGVVDSAGRFELIQLDPGDYDLVAFGNGGDAHLPGVRAGTHDVVLRWMLNGAIEGRVRGAGGDAIVGATISVFREGSRGTSASSSGDHFQISVPPGRYRLLARSGALVGVSDGDVEVAESAVVRGADVVLAPAGSVAGVIRSADGKPVSHAHFMLRQRGGVIAFDAQADDSGAYRIDGVPAGEYEVRYSTFRPPTPLPRVTVGVGENVTFDLTSL